MWSLVTISLNWSGLIPFLEVSLWNVKTSKSSIKTEYLLMDFILLETTIVPFHAISSSPTSNSDAFFVLLIVFIGVLLTTQPNVLNLASIIISFSTSICSLITSPHSGAPTRPVPTVDLDLSRVPIFLGFE